MPPRSRWRAFEEDYARAALVMGITADHDWLQYELQDDIASIYINSFQLMIDPPSSYYWVWYMGYPDSQQWMLQEAQLVLMTGDGILSADEARALIATMF